MPPCHLASKAQYDERSAATDERSTPYGWNPQMDVYDNFRIPNYVTIRHIHQNILY